MTKNKKEAPLKIKTDFETALKTLVKDKKQEDKTNPTKSNSKLGK